MQLTGKHVVITGGSEGLGFALAKSFVEKGSIVHIIGRKRDKLDDATEKLGKKVSSHIADVSVFGEISKVANEIGQIDVLINNAGVWIEGSILESSEEEISKAIDINLKGVIYTTKAFLPKFDDTSEAHIVNISSTSGLRGRDNQSVYVATKFGVTGFTESLKLDLASTNIKVSGFYPGGMSTNLFEKAGKSKNNKDWMDTNKVAEVILFMIERDLTMVMDHVVLNKRNTKKSN